MTSERDWTGLTDRLVAGDRLSPEETRRLEDAAAADPARASELALLDRLAGFVDAPRPEPSSDSIAIAHAALARVAGGAPPVASARPGRVRPLAIAGVAAAALAAAALAVLVLRPSADVEVTPVAVPAAGAWVSIASGEVTIDGRAIGDAPPRLSSSTTLAVREGRACVAIEPGIDVCLDAATTASVEDLEAAEIRVDVRRGHAVARLDPLPAGRSFALGAAQIRAVAVGTIFSIDVSEDGESIRAAVLDGEVEVRARGATMRLGAHEVARVHEGGIERDRLAADTEAIDLDLLATMPDIDGDIGHVAIEVSPASATVIVDDRVLGASPLLVALAAGEHRLELRAAGGARLGETLAVQPGTVVLRRFTLSGIEPLPELDAEPTIMAEDTGGAELDRTREITSSPRTLLAEARTLRR
ncbi:MAG TPA: PEGA domain-containing protein, partial [Nannocystaceae bacterium]|nr:PEGA domain-containing protein [Nannocystaceae bacterium]